MASDEVLTRSVLLERLADLIVSVELPHPVRVAIDGVDAAGKTTLADELVIPIQQRDRPAIRASVDSFHRPKSERYRRGVDSPEGYYHDSYDYDSLVDELLVQLGPGGSLRYRPATFDYKEDLFIYESLRNAEPNAVLLFDGIFLLRPELNDFWDFRIFLDVEFEVSVERDIRRSVDEEGSTSEGLLERQQKRYMPGQRIYLKSVRPKEIANVVVDNNDLKNPRILAVRLS